MEVSQQKNAGVYCQAIANVYDYAQWTFTLYLI